MARNQALRVFKDELHISHSQIFTYTACSLKYRFMYVESRRPERISIALPFGGAIHAGIERFYRSLKDTNQRESLDVLEDVFVKNLRQEVDHTDVPVIYKKEAPDKDAVIQMGRGLLKAFYDSVDLAGMKIVAVELPLSARMYTPNGEATEMKLVGILDLLLENEDRELLVVDHKTSARKKSQSTVDDELQMTAYSYLLAASGYAYPSDETNCRMDVLRKLKTPKMEYYHTVRTRADRKRFAKVVSAVLSGIENRVFFPNKSWLCSDCQYSKACEAW